MTTATKTEEGHLEKLMKIQSAYRDPKMKAFEKQAIINDWMHSGDMDALVDWMGDQIVLMEQVMAYMKKEKDQRNG